MVNKDTHKIRKTSKINTWEPKPDQIYVEPDGRIFICNFDKIFQHEKLAKFNKFYIKKGSYENQLDIITQYTNFFIANYDTDEELIAAYLKIKYAVDEQQMFNKDNMDAFISFIYEVMFTDTIIEKIKLMVEENYLDDIETDSDEKKRKYQKNEKKHLESLEFTNQHIKILLCISFAMKILCPAMLHYHAIHAIKIEKDSDNIFRFYKPLFDIFSVIKKHDDEAHVLYDVDENGVVTESGYFFIKNISTGYYDKYDDRTGELVISNITSHVVNRYRDDGQILIEPRDYYANYNIYNKLFVYVKAKVNESYSNNAPIFDQQEIFGVDIYSVVHSFVRRVLISENIVKYKFNKEWDSKLKKFKENIIGFNKTIIKYQLLYFLKEQYGKNLTEITNSKNTDGLSGADKMLMNLSKIDEGITIMSDINIPLTISYLQKRFNVSISPEEIDFYVKHHKPQDIQIQLVYSFFAKYLGSYRDLKLCSRRDYIKLVLILKKKLMVELGYDDNSDDIVYDTSEIDTEGANSESDESTSTYKPDYMMRPVALPYIISGNLSDHINTRVIRNIKFTEKVESSYTFQKLQEENHKYLNFIKPGFDMQLISSLVNTRFTYVEYKHPELLDIEITYNDDKIADEILFFLTSI